MLGFNCPNMILGDLVETGKTESLSRIVLIMGFQSDTGYVVCLSHIGNRVVISYMDNTLFIAVVNNPFGPPLRIIVLEENFVACHNVARVRMHPKF